MAADTEECCICLSALSSGPVVALLREGNGTASCRRACRHYLHAGCVTGLSPAKCPLCRVQFTQTSAPISASTLQAHEPQDVTSGLLRMLGETGDHAPTPAVLELLAATLPVPTANLQRAAADIDCDQRVGPRDLETLLAQYGLPQLRRALSGRSVMYSPRTRLVRRLRWLVLKLAGALGAGLHVGLLGATAGVAFGLLAASVPDLPASSPGVSSPPPEGSTTESWADFISDLDDDWEPDGIGSFLTRMVIVFFVILLYYLLLTLARLVRRLNRGVKPRDLVLRCGRWGAAIGMLAGWSHGLGAVDPNDHGPRSVFVTGLRGETTWRHLLRDLCASRRLGHVDVFAADRSYRI